MGAELRPGNGIGMKTSIRMLTAIAVVAIMCVCPLFVAVDDSDAYDVTTGESGLSVTMENLPKEKVNELFTDDKKTEMAKDAVSAITSYSSYSMSISALEISGLKIERGLSTRVTDDTAYIYSGTRMEYTATFKLTFTTATDIVNNNSAFIEVVKAIGTDNRSINGDFFEITAKVVTIETGKEVNEFVKNEDGNFVITSKQTTGYESTESEVTAKFIYTRDAVEKNVSFTAKYTTENSVDQKQDYDFNGVDPVKAKDTTSVYYDGDVGAMARYKFEVTYDGDTKKDGGTYDLSALMMALGGGKIVDKADVYDADMKAATITYMGDNPRTCLFEESDIALATENDLKTFVAANGSADESYSGAKDVYDEYNSTVVDDRDMMNLLLIGAVAILGFIIVVLIVVLIIVLIVKRKKR